MGHGSDRSLPARLGQLAGSELVAADECNKLIHLSWLASRTAGMRVEADDELCLVDSGLGSDSFNVVCRARLTEESLAPRIAQVVAHFQAVQHPFAWWVGPADRPARLGEALIGAGFAAVGTEPGMAANLETIEPARPEPRGLRMVRAATPGQVHDFATVLAGLATPPDQAVLRFYQAATPALLSVRCPVWLYVGYLDETPVATAELTIGGEIVGLYAVATMENHRRQGIGTAMTARALSDARAAGFQRAVLQASPQGLSVYARLGFERVGWFTEYQLPRGAIVSH